MKRHCTPQRLRECNEIKALNEVSRSKKRAKLVLHREREGTFQLYVSHFHLRIRLRALLCIFLGSFRIFSRYFYLTFLKFIFLHRLPPSSLSLPLSLSLFPLPPPLPWKFLIPFAFLLPPSSASRRARASFSLFFFLFFHLVHFPSSFLHRGYFSFFSSLSLSSHPPVSLVGIPGSLLLRARLVCLFLPGYYFVLS